MPRATFSQIANRSMSEVFTRSLATSFVVLMPVGSLLLFGGDTLKDFAFALLVGVASGAYSSIFIATPVLVEWKERERELHAPPPPRHGGERRRGAAVRLGDDRGQGRRGGQRHAARAARGPPGPRAAHARPARRRAGRQAPPPRAAPPRAARTRTSADDSGNGGPPPRSRRRRRTEPRRRAGRRAAAAQVGHQHRRAPERRRPKPKPSAVRARSTGGTSHVTGRLGDDGNRGLALHGVPAGPLLGRHRRGLPGGGGVGACCSASSSTARRCPARNDTAPDPGADRDSGRDHRARASRTSGAPGWTAPRASITASRAPAREH